jgi:hypothetical protein
MDYQDRDPHPIPRRYHWFTDYSYVPTVAAAPELFGFADNKTATTLARIFSGTILASSIFTRAEWGAVKVLPYKAHVALDFASGVAALAMPWLAGFAEHRAARNTFLGMGIVGITVGLLSGILTGPKEMPAASYADSRKTARRYRA